MYVPVFIAARTVLAKASGVDTHRSRGEKRVRHEPLPEESERSSLGVAQPHRVEEGLVVVGRGTSTAM